jgi:hypothetical protein
MSLTGKSSLSHMPSMVNDHQYRLIQDKLTYDQKKLKELKSVRDNYRD